MKTSNVAYQAGIIRRMFKDEQEFLNFHQNYNRCKHRSYTLRQPSAQDLEMFNQRKAGLTITEIAQKHGVKYRVASNAISRVALSLALAK